MSKAPAGEIYVSEFVRQAHASRASRWTELEPLELKGKSPLPLPRTR